MTPDMLNQLSAVIEHKTLSTGFVSILMKAIFANFFINISLVIAMQIDDVLAKMFVMMFGVLYSPLWVMNMSFTTVAYLWVV